VTDLHINNNDLASDTMHGGGSLTDDVLSYFTNVEKLNLWGSWRTTIHEDVRLVATHLQQQQHWQHASVCCCNLDFACIQTLT
jgi:hypothetical protein